MLGPRGRCESRRMSLGVGAARWILIGRRAGHPLLFHPESIGFQGRALS